MITRETDYALRTALYLAKCARQDNGVISTAALAEAMAIPYRFLRKIVSKMVAAKLVESRRGKGGGLVLSRNAHTISLLQIIQAVAPESVQMNLCSGGTESRCNRSPRCGIRKELDSIQHQLHASLAGISLDAVVQRDTHSL